MIDYQAHRRKLLAKIEQAKQGPQSDLFEEKNTCAHDWSKYRQTVLPDGKSKFTGTAYFVVRGCAKCKEKRTIDYIVENVHA